MIYFSYAELGAADAPEQIRRNVARLCSGLLDPVREAIGRPILINSGYRSPEHNRRVGGSPTSDHLRGLAADIRIAGLTGPGIKKLILPAITRLGLTFDQLIVYPRFVHLSYRPEEGNREMILVG
ncbi:MAG: D-Ala-D-Ala carboxypeptidase family metallohydrolase [Odoribacter sp.]